MCEALSVSRILTQWWLVHKKLMSLIFFWIKYYKIKFRPQYHNHLLRYSEDKPQPILSAHRHAYATLNPYNIIFSFRFRRTYVHNTQSHKNKLSSRSFPQRRCSTLRISCMSERQQVPSALEGKVGWVDTPLLGVEWDSTGAMRRTLAHPTGVCFCYCIHGAQLARRASYSPIPSFSQKSWAVLPAVQKCFVIKYCFSCPVSY